MRSSIIAAAPPDKTAVREVHLCDPVIISYSSEHFISDEEWIQKETMLMKRIVLSCAVLVFALLALGPPLCQFGGSFFVDGALSLENYKNILLNERQMGLLWHSFLVGMLTVFLTCLVGIPFGIILSRIRPPLEGVLRFLYLIPVMLPTYVIGIALTERIPLSGLSGTVIILGLSFWPIMALFTEKGLRSVGRDTEDAGLLVAAPSRVFASVTLPLASPSILTGALFVFIFSVSDFGIPDLLSFTSTNSYQVFSSEIFYRWDKLRRSGEATAASLPIIILCLGALLLILRLEGRARRSTLSGSFQPRLRAKARITFLPLYLFMVLAVTASVLFPLAILFMWLGRAGSLSEMGSYLIRSLSDTGADAYNSIIASVLAAGLMVVIGFFLAYLIERGKGRYRNLFTFLSFLPLVFPAVMIGISEIRFWNHSCNPLRDIIYDQRGMLVVTYFARFIPVAVLCLRSSIIQVDRSMEEASLVSGRGFLYTISHVLLPMCWRGIWVAFLLGYIFSMRELDTIAIIGAGNNTLPFRIYSQIHTSRDVVIAAHCLVLILTLLIPPLIYRLFVRGRVKII